MRTNDRHLLLRQQIAQAAARIMAEDGYRSFHQARQKAAQQLGVSNAKLLPANQEIEQALIEYQQLFMRDSQQSHLRRLRKIACKAMRFLQAFTPRLVGPVLKGTAGEFNPVSLHLFSDCPDDIGLFLQDKDVPYSTDERKLRLNTHLQADYPVYRFMAENTEVELVIFPVNGSRQAPLSSVDNKPMRRAKLDEVEALVASEMNEN